MRSRIMYVEARGPDGRLRLARIARVRFSKTGRSIHFDGRELLGVGRGEYWTEIRGLPARVDERVTYG